jgi:hypothetical protein
MIKEMHAHISELSVKAERVFVSMPNGKFDKVKSCFWKIN